MTALTIALVAGAMIGLGLAMLLWRLVPAQPDLGAALDNLAPEASLARPADIPTAADTQDRLGLWVMRTLPVSNVWSTPTKELALLRRTPHALHQTSRRWVQRCIRDGPCPASSVVCPAGGTVDLWSSEGAGHVPVWNPTFTETWFDWFQAHARTR